MARTSKTKVGKAVDTRAMLEAGKSQSRVSAQIGKQAEFEERKAQDVQRAAGAVDQGIQFKEQQADRKAEFGAQMDLRERQFAEQKRATGVGEQQAQERQNMQAASSGLQPTGSDREAALAQEMEQGAQEQTPEQKRLAAQGDKAIEIPGPNRQAVPGREYERTPEAREAQASERAQKQEAIDLKRMEITGKIARARAKGDEDSVAFQQEQLGTVIKSNIGRMNRVMAGNGTPNDWGDIRSMAEDAGDPALLDAIEQAQTTGEVGGRIRDFLNNQIVAGKGGVLDYIEADGDMPKQGVDSSSPAMQQFYQNVGILNGAIKQTLAKDPNSIMYRGIKTLEDKIRFVQSEAAWWTKKQLGGQERDTAMNQANENVMASQQADPAQQAAIDQESYQSAQQGMAEHIQGMPGPGQEQQPSAPPMTQRGGQRTPSQRYGGGGSK